MAKLSNDFNLLANIASDLALLGDALMSDIAPGSAQDDMDDADVLRVLRAIDAAPCRVRGIGSIVRSLLALDAVRDVRSVDLDALRICVEMRTPVLARDGGRNARFSVLAFAIDGADLRVVAIDDGRGVEIDRAVRGDDFAQDVIGWVIGFRRGDGPADDSDAVHVEGIPQEIDLFLA